MKLSFSTCYYIRKVLLQHAKDLQWILEQNNGFCINTTKDWKELLDSVYLEDVLEQLLLRLYGDNEINAAIQQLETLCLSHQKLIAQNLTHSEAMLSIQQQIFWILGFKRIEITFEEVVNALNQLSKYCSNFLGTKLTANNWQSNRPNTDWLNNFSIDSSAKFAFSSKNSEITDFGQLQLVYEWVKAFVEQHTKTFRDFPSTIEQKKLGEVKKGLLLTRLGNYSALLNIETKPLHSWVK